MNLPWQPFRSIAMSRKILSQSLAEQISGQDLGDARVFFENELKQANKQLRALGDEASELDGAYILIQMARSNLGLGDKETCWQTARPLLDVFIESGEFELAVEACELLYLAEQEDSIIALGHACWLAVTYPMKPALSVDMLSYIIDETPDNSDGAAVAGVVALYLAEIRAEGSDRDSLVFLAKQLIAIVAKRHRGIEDEESIQIWIEMLELNDLDELFKRLAKMLDAIVEIGRAHV